jgi:translation initiation factor 2 beta subunit (eIF-2beta)/eIF-5
MIVFDEFNNALRRCEVCGKAKENVSGKENRHFAWLVKRCGNISTTGGIY